MIKPILCLDFDGVVSSYASGWKGSSCLPDMPVSGALEFIVKATEHFKVNIFSCRTHQKGGRTAMRYWLYKRYLEIGGVRKTRWPSPFVQFKVTKDIPEIPKWYWDAILDKTSMEPWEWEVHYGVKRLLKQIEFPKHKPHAMISIDDRAIQFTGVWPDLKELKSFKPWNKQNV